MTRTVPAAPARRSMPVILKLWACPLSVLHAVSPMLNCVVISICLVGVKGLFAEVGAPGNEPCGEEASGGYGHCDDELREPQRVVAWIVELRGGNRDCEHPSCNAEEDAGDGAESGLFSFHI